MTEIVFKHREFGNPHALIDYQLVVDIEAGDYFVQPEDLPVYQIYQCGLNETDLSIHVLEAGEENDSGRRTTSWPFTNA